MRIPVDVLDHDLGAVLKSLNAALDPDDLADEATALLLNRIRTRFLNEEGPDGKWKPSKAAIKRRAKGGTGTLFNTGTLFHSIQAVRTEEGTRSIQTDVPYGKYHQYGKGDMHRVFLHFKDDDVTLVEKLISRRIKGIKGISS